MAFLVYQTGFIKSFMVLNPDKCFFILFGVRNELQRDLVSNNVTIKNSKEENRWKSLLITNLDSTRILLALPKNEYKAQISTFPGPLSH